MTYLTARVDMGAVRYFVLLFLAVLVPACKGFGNFYDRNGVVLPNDPYIYVGNNLTLTCNLTKYDEVTYNSQYLSFSRKKDEVIPSSYVTILSTRSIILRYPINSPDDAGHYLCKLNRTANRPEIIGTQIVIVDYEPQVVTEINCRVYNWDNMTCTWDLGVQFVHPNTMNITLSWTVEDMQQADCKHQTPTSCSWWSNEFMSDTTYYMAVQIINDRTKKKYPERLQVTTVDSTKIVEPAPVEFVTAERNSTCIMIQWQHEKIRQHKVYKVNFKHKMARHWEIKEVGDSESLTLCGLRPNSMYEFQIRCLPRLFGGVEQGFWSQPTEISVKTDEDVPTKAPELLPGSYMEVLCQTLCKKLMLYWKPVSLLDANGNITYYQVDYTDMSTSNRVWEHIRATQPETQHQLILLANHAYQIQIRAATAKGPSNVLSQIYIPASSQRPEVPDHVVKSQTPTQSDRGTIMWTPVSTEPSRYWKRLVSYTVFWCRGYKIEGRCQEMIQSIDVPITETSLDLSLEDFELYMYGVSVNAITASGETISSGFKWNKCIYVDNTRPTVAPTNVRLSLYQPNSGLSIEWDKLSCEDTNAFILHYHVSICPSDSGLNCSGPVSNFEVDKEQSFIRIPDLEEGARYKIWVYAASNVGLSEASEPMYTQVIDRRLNSGEIVGIVVASLFVLFIFLFGIILCSKRVYVSVKQRYFDPVPIEIPHTLPPLPPIPMPPRQNTPDSDESDGIYEKIVDGPPSPGSSTESTTGVEAPLISHKLKFSSIKNHIYGCKKDSKHRQRHSSDSGRDSMSHSADTLLMRLHPSHLRKKKFKKTQKSESDSGVMVDGRGQVCMYTNSTQSEDGTYRDNSEDYQSDVEKDKIKCGTVNPYSCVDIIDKLDCKSEQLIRKLSEKEVNETSRCNGSTLSLPPGFCKTALISSSLNCRAKSAGNELDFDSHNRLSSMKETKEFESSDICSEDGTLDSLGDLEHETSESLSSREPESVTSRSDGSQGPRMSSYIKFTDGKQHELGDNLGMDEHSKFLEQLNCSCHRNPPQLIVGDGYVTEAAMGQQSMPQNCQCGQQKINGVNGSNRDDRTFLHDMKKSGIRPGSQVYNLPPHFFGSMSSVPVDPDRTTEL